MLQKFGYMLKYNPLAAVLVVVSTVLMLALAAVWYGLLKLNPTAWKIAIALGIIGLITNTISMNIPAVVFGILILLYLYSKKELYLGPAAEATETGSGFVEQ